MFTIRTRAGWVFDRACWLAGIALAFILFPLTEALHFLGVTFLLVAGIQLGYALGHREADPQSDRYRLAWLSARRRADQNTRVKADA